MRPHDEAISDGEPPKTGIRPSSECQVLVSDQRSVSKGNGLARSSASCLLFFPPLAERATPEAVFPDRKGSHPGCCKPMVDNGNDAVRMDGSSVPPEAEAITGTKQSFAPARYSH